MDQVEIGQRIAQARNDASLTQEELAELGSFSLRSLQDYETGRTSPYKRLREIATILNVPVEWLLHGEHPTPAANHQFQVIEQFLVELQGSLSEALRLLRELRGHQAGPPG